MTLPTPGVSLSMSQIQGEFGGSNPISLSEYYAGGSYVPAGTTGSNGAVPSGGTISISQFYGTSNAIIAFDSYTLSDFQLDPNDAICYYRINSNGNVYGTSVGIPFDLLEQWATPTSIASQYEVYATLNTGSLSGGTTGSWLSLGTTQDWWVERTSIGSKVANMTMEVRKIGTSTVLDTWTIEIEALVEI
jgi:hypothetical protein